MREKMTDKVLVLGIDGMDPRLTKKFLNEGKLPNVKKYIERGACREDLVMLGGQPTVTPPMWTTLATGAYPVTHGITDFFRQSPTDLDMVCYNLDSRLCKAEQVWNCFAEAGKKTLVWHWPGSSWPPSSDSPNLMVVDGSSPGTVNQARGQIGMEMVVVASETITNTTFVNSVDGGASAPCVITDLEIAEDKGSFDAAEHYTAMEMKAIVQDIFNEGSLAATMRHPVDVAQSTIKPASGWAEVPEDAKEFTMLLSKGFIRRPCLILKNEEGIYDTVAIYKSKKETTPIATLKNGVYGRDVVDEGFKGDQHFSKCNRDMCILDMDPEGKTVKIWVSPTMNAEMDEMFSPKELYKTVTENIGFPPAGVIVDGSDEQMLNVMLEAWYHVADWQSETLNYLIEHENLDAVFSHYHNVDLQEHTFLTYVHDKGFNKNPEAVYEKALENVYIQTDYYLGKFLHLLDKGWSIIITSDHGLVCSTNFPVGFGDMMGVNIPFMEELGYTVMKRDAEGNKTSEIDWTKTKAIATRSLHIYLNLKGRTDHGIVDPEDQYQLEEEIMTAMYGYKHPKTGQRVVALALRNRDAILLGVGGPESGDIICWTAEGYNYDHADGLSTAYGNGDTSLSPIFIAAGKGIKAGFTTDRIIREVDVAPTAAILGGVRMPAQCEGAPVYQIFEEEF